METHGRRADGAIQERARWGISLAMAGVVALEAGRAAYFGEEHDWGEPCFQRWVRWYEEGGLEELARHRLGGCGKRAPVWHEDQREALMRRAMEEGFRTIGEAMQGCEAELGVEVKYSKLYYWFRKWELRKKVPWSMAQKADVEPQEVWKKSVWGGALGGRLEAWGCGGICG